MINFICGISFTFNILFIIVIILVLKLRTKKDNVSRALNELTKMTDSLQNIKLTNDKEINNAIENKEVFKSFWN